MFFFVLTHRFRHFKFLKELTGCVITSQKLMNGSSLLSSTLLEYLTKNIDDSHAKFKEFLRPAVDACYGDMTENQLQRLESYHTQALDKKDGGASSSPVGSFILGESLDAIGSSP